MKDPEDAENQITATSPPLEEKSSLDRRRFLGGVGALAGGLTVGALAGGGAVSALAGKPSSRAGSVDTRWGPRVDLTGLKENFAPQQVRPFTVPPGGIDNLALHSTDAFTIPGHGEFVVDFAGYFRVARANPSNYDWATSDIRVNIIDLRLFGRHEQLGEILVTLNPDIVSSGQLLPKTSAKSASTETTAEVTEPLAEEAKDCRIATAVLFDMGPLGIVFNKEPILLMNQHVTRIPPVDDPSGRALLFRLPLFSRKNPDGEPVAYLTSLRYGADNYLNESDVRGFRERRRREET